MHRIKVFIFFQDVPCGQDFLDHGVTLTVKMEGGNHTKEVKAHKYVANFFHTFFHFILFIGPESDHWLSLSLTNQLSPVKLTLLM